MMEEDQFTSFEARLASIRPRGTRLNRDQLMYLAGQASVVYWPRYRPRTLRPALFSAIAAAALTFLILTATESGSRIVDRVASAATTHKPAVARRVPPGRDVGYRLEVGNSLGWFFALFVGPRDAEDGSADREKNLVRWREELIQETAGGGRPEAQPKQTEESPPIEE